MSGWGGDCERAGELRTRVEIVTAPGIVTRQEIMTAPGIVSLWFIGAHAFSSLNALIKNRALAFFVADAW